MRDIFKFEKRYKYPHMKPRDVAIWERFIDKYKNAFDTVQYDFNVGDPPPFDPMGDDGEDLNQDALYRLKIDVVAHVGNQIYIIEVKPNANSSTIGQIEAYKEIYIRDEQPKNKVNMIILTDTILPNMKYLCEKKDIQLVIV